MRKQVKLKTKLLSHAGLRGWRSIFHLLCLKFEAMCCFSSCFLHLARALPASETAPQVNQQWL
jgi:hypothetical protein